MLAARVGSYTQFPDPYFIRRDTDAMNISDVSRKCVAFLGIRKNGRFHPKATCFFVRYTEDQHSFDHLVTAEHVISGLLTKGHDIWLRANKETGGCCEIRFDDPHVFRFHPNNEVEPTDVSGVSDYDHSY